ncbi:MAG TPA: hypothetical protein VGD62_02925 [Acidobacteriaceae bacterium]
MLDSAGRHAAARLARRTTPRLVLLALLLASGCRSRFIQVSIQNETTQTLRTVEVDYPSASFGISTLAPHATYTYRFKAQGSGPLTLSYNESTGAAHASTGPVVHEDDQGSVTLQILDGGSVTWQPTLTRADPNQQQMERNPADETIAAWTAGDYCTLDGQARPFQNGCDGW